MNSELKNTIDGSAQKKKKKTVTKQPKAGTKKIKTVKKKVTKTQKKGKGEDDSSSD